MEKRPINFPGKNQNPHKWSEKSIDSLTMGPIFDIGEQKADQYLGIRAE